MSDNETEHKVELSILPSRDGTEAAYRMEITGTLDGFEDMLEHLGTSEFRTTITDAVLTQVQNLVTYGPGWAAGVNDNENGENA